MKQLTPTQAAALETYRALVERLGYLPSNREFQDAMGYASSSSAASMLRQLQKAGFPCHTRVIGSQQSAEDLARASAYWVQERSPRIVEVETLAARRIAQLEEQLERALAEIERLSYELEQQGAA
jgi:SOS-response transcriptional repressor LexA